MRRRKPAARNRRDRDLADESQKSTARQDLSPRESAGAIIDLSAGFNTYGMNWIPGKSITWYLNGQQVWTGYERPSSNPEWAHGAPSEQWGREFRRPVLLALRS